MSENLPEMPYLRNIGLIVTYKCQVACPHCIIEAGPNRKEQLRPQTAQDWIEQIANYRDGYIKVLSLTGGEPFYNISNLQKISSMGEEHGLLVSAVTNAFWATTNKKAKEILKHLPAIKMLSISADAYHQQEIPFERVQNAINAAKKLGLPYQIAVCTENHNDHQYKQIVKKLEELTDSSKIKTAITFPVGRGQKLSRKNYLLSEIPPVSACSAGSSPIIFPNGNIIGCIGPVINIKQDHPLLLGNLYKNSLEQILDLSETNPIYHAIRIWGPRKLITMADEAGLSKYLPTKYVEQSICHACYNLLSNAKIRAFLVNLTQDFEFQRKVAYARLYYLRENQMFNRMKPQLLQHECLRD